MSHHHAGSALITVLIISVAIAGIMMALVDTSVSNLTREQRREQLIHRQAAAESAANLVLLGVLQSQSSTPPSTAISLSSTSRSSVAVDLAASNSVAAMVAYQTSLQVTNSGLSPALKMTSSSGSMLAGGTKMTATIYPLPWDFTTNLCTAAAGGSISSWLIKAQAQDGNAAQAKGYDRDRVEIRLSVNPSTINGKGLFSANNYEFKGSATTDSWNSSTGPYNPLTPGSNGNIYAISGLPLISNAGVSGGAYQTSDPLPAVAIPSPLPGIALPGSVSSGSGGSRVTSKTLVAGTTYSCTGDLPDVSYIVGSGGDVTIYVAGAINLSTPITFVDIRKSSALPAGNRLWIYQTDYGAARTTLNGNAMTGSASDPGRVIIQSAFTGEITLNGSASLGGVLIAPNATLKLLGNFDFFGCLWVNQMFQDQVAGNFKFHYDDYLNNFRIPGNPTYSVSGWRSYTAGWNQ